MRGHVCSRHDVYYTWMDGWKGIVHSHGQVLCEPGLEENVVESSWHCR
jgi:hypothetical protein